MELGVFSAASVIGKAHSEPIPDGWWDIVTSPPCMPFGIKRTCFRYMVLWGRISTPILRQLEPLCSTFSAVQRRPLNVLTGQYDTGEVTHLEPAAA